MRILRKSQVDILVTDIEYAKTQLEYICSVIDYFDKSKISKSVTEEAVKRLDKSINTLNRKK